MGNSVPKKNNLPGETLFGYLITDCVAHSTHLLLLGTWSHWNIYLARWRFWEDTELGDKKGRKEMIYIQYENF